MKPNKTWILIADAGRARIFLNAGPGKGLVPALEGEIDGVHKFSREIGSDRPGRSFDSAGTGARHAMEPPTDPLEAAKRNFARDLAKLLEDGLKQAAYDRLILVAPPRMLGDLRDALSDNVRAKLMGELNKDLTHATVQELPGHLVGLLAV